MVQENPIELEDDGLKEKKTNQGKAISFSGAYEFSFLGECE